MKLQRVLWVCFAVLLLAGGIAGAQATKSVTIFANFINWKAWPDFQQDFEKTTGIKINAIMAPSDTNEMKMKLTTMLAAGDSTYDVMYIDELMAVGFAPAKFLEPIDDVMTKSVAADFAPDVIDRISTYKGKIYSVPVDTQPMFFYVNRPMFKDAGVKIPTTGAEFLAAAHALTKGDVYGYGASWITGGYLYNDAIRWMYVFGGDYLNWKKPGSRQGLQYMYDLLYKEKVVSTASITENYDVLNQKLKEGKVGMIFQWSYVTGVLGDSFPNPIDIAPMPKFTTNKTLVGGWHFTLNAFSKNKAAGKEFLKFAASVKGQTHFVDFDFHTAANFKVLTDPVNIAKVPMLKYIGDYLGAKSLVPRPSNGKITEIMDTTEPIIQSYLSKQITLDECVSKGQVQIDLLMAQLK
jgi:multiple sugar transport system substrate-binding protein